MFQLIYLSLIFIGKLRVNPLSVDIVPGKYRGWIVMKIKNIFLIASVIFMIAALESCREGIIDPGNSVGNVNEPVVLKSSDAYIFQIDAKNITFSKTDETFLDVTDTDIILELKDYSSGSVHVRVIADNLSTLYNELLSNDINGLQKSVVNHVVEKIQLDFNDFSGNLKVKMVKSPRNY